MPNIIERAPIRSCVRRGAAIDLILDRARENRSQLLFTTARGRDAVFRQSRAPVSRPGRTSPRRLEWGETDRPTASSLTTVPTWAGCGCPRRACGACFSLRTSISGRCPSLGAACASRSRTGSTTDPVDLRHDLLHSGLVTAETITACAKAAIRDLRGSINPEALPEMAVRLAPVRLAERAANGNAKHGTDALGQRQCSSRSSNKQQRSKPPWPRPPGSYGPMIFEFGAARPLAVVVAEEFPQLLRRCRCPGSHGHGGGRRAESGGCCGRTKRLAAG